MWKEIVIAVVLSIGKMIDSDDRVKTNISTLRENWHAML